MTRPGSRRPLNAQPEDRGTPRAHGPDECFPDRHLDAYPKADRDLREHRARSALGRPVP